jgi:hypothetical protein
MYYYVLIHSPPPPGIADLLRPLPFLRAYSLGEVRHVVALGIRKGILNVPGMEQGFPSWFARPNTA